MPASHHRATIPGPEPETTIHVTMYPLQSTRTQVILCQWRKFVIRNHLFPTRAAELPSAVEIDRPPGRICEQALPGILWPMDQASETPFPCAITLPLVILGGLGSADSSFSSFTQAAAILVASSVCAGLLNSPTELKTPFPASIR